MKPDGRTTPLSLGPEAAFAFRTTDGQLLAGANGGLYVNGPYQCGQKWFDEAEVINDGAVHPSGNFWFTAVETMPKKTHSDICGYSDHEWIACRASSPFSMARYAAPADAVSISLTYRVESSAFCWTDHSSPLIVAYQDHPAQDSMRQC